MERLALSLLLLTAVASCVILLARPGAEASPDATITVNSTADTDSRDGVLTLREAMLLATGGLAVGTLDSGECAQVSNSSYDPPCSTTDTIGSASADTIAFDAFVGVITIGSTLPTLGTGGDTVDDSAASVLVSAQSSSLDCFEITSNGNAIKGLDIRMCNRGAYIHGGAQGNTIGGITTPGQCDGDCNGIWAYDAGVEISGTDTSGNVVSGNSIRSVPVPPPASGTGTGVLVSQGAQNNTIGGTGAGEGNTIRANYDDGIRVDGAATTGNSIRGNSIYSNGLKGIENIDGGNMELPPPIVDTVAGSASGHSDPKCYPCTVEVFSDDEDEGRIYHGSTTTNDDATGTWSYAGGVTGPNITATVTDADGNTSEFSPPFTWEPDSDGDSLGLGPSGGFFRDGAETHMGTDPLDECADTDTPNDERGPDHGEPLSPWPPDFNDNGRIEIGDLVGLKNHWVPLGNPYGARYDLNANGECDIGDLVVLKQYWTGGGYDTCTVG